MRTTRLFRNIWRANAVIILGAGVVALLLGLIAGYYILKDLTRNNHTPVVQAEAAGEGDQSFALGDANQIAGHPWLLLALEGEHDYDHRLYSSDDARVVRNYAFVSGSLETRWLYPHNRFVIVDATQLPRGDDEHGSSATRLVSFRVVQQDTDGDKRLTSDDAFNLVFAGPDGNGVTTVLENVIEIVSQELVGEEVVVVYKDRDGYAAATYSLRDFSAVKRQRISLPPSGA